MKEFPPAVAKVRSQHGQSPRDVLAFLQDMIKYNDNRVNSVSSHFQAVDLPVNSAVFLLAVFRQFLREQLG